MNKKLVTAAIGAGLAAAFGPAHAVFKADASYGLVPYVVKDASRTTVVTAIMDDDGAIPGGDFLHVQYWTKSTTDANTAACQPSSVTIPKTPNDIVTFDTAGILGYPLFGDTTNPAPLGVAIAYPAPRHGFLMLESIGEIELNGLYWLELDLANGGAHGDMGLLANAPDLFNYSFSRGHILNGGEGSYNGDATPVPFWPSSVASTVFTVTPLGSDMLNRENNQAVVQVINEQGVQGAYDRNENGVDGTVPVTVRCVGRVTPAQLMPGVVANAAWAAQGGFGYLFNRGDGDTQDSEQQGGTNSGDLDAVVYQVDTSSVGGKFMINATRVVSDQGDRD